VDGILELKLMPFADDHADGSRETLLTEATLFGHLSNDLVIGALEVDHTGDIFVTHWLFLIRYK
jgi:hypothetical protein